MENLIKQITHAITFDNSYDDKPGFVESRWFRWSGIGEIRTASPHVFGIQVLVKTTGKTKRVCVFWAVADTLRFDNLSFKTESPFPPRPGDTFTYGFDGEETLFEVVSVSPENEGILRIEAESFNFPI